MSFSIVHLSDIHFGYVADLQKVVAVQNLIPDLEPDVTVLSGDLTLRSRHGEFQAARLLVQELERTAPVFVIIFTYAILFLVTWLPYSFYSNTQAPMCLIWVLARATV